MNIPSEKIKVIKLSSGDTLVADFSLHKQHNPPYATLVNPIKFDTVPREDGSATLLAQKWLQTDDTSLTIPFYHIVAVVTPNETILDYYIDTLLELAEHEAESYDDEEMDVLRNIPAGSTYH